MLLPVPEDYPYRYQQKLQLKNGSTVLLRPILPTDGPLLVDLFNRLSPEARYLRFLSHIPALTEQMLYRFTHVDYCNEFALVAVVTEEGSDSIIAVGRYALDVEAKCADLAVAVRDDWQHVGLGKLLLINTVAIARDHGISCFGSLMEPENEIIRKMLSDLGYEVKYLYQNGAFHVKILA